MSDMISAGSPRIGLLSLWIAVALAVATPARAEPPVVTWEAPYFPPFFMGPVKKPYGIFDRLHHRVENLLPFYNHRFQEAGYARIIYDLQSESLSCSYALFRTPKRDEFITYSHPLIPLIPPGIVMKRDQVEKLTSLLVHDHRVSLERLLRQSDLRIGFVRGRSYGTKVDKILRRVVKDEPPHRTFKVSRASLLIKMLDAGRIDLALAYSSEISYYAKDPGKTLTAFSLTEQPAYNLAYYGCSKSDAGTSVIDSVNRALDQQDLRKGLAEDYRKMLSPDSRPGFDAIYNDFKEQQAIKR